MDQQLYDRVVAILCKYNSADDPNYWYEVINREDPFPQYLESFALGQDPLSYWEAFIKRGDGAGKKPCQQSTPTPEPTPVPPVPPSIDFPAAFAQLSGQLAHLQATIDGYQDENRGAFKQLAAFAKRAFPWIK